MASPSALVLFVTNTVASTASRTHVRDDRETPLWVARDGRQSAGDFRDGSIADACDQLARRANQQFVACNWAKKVKIVGRVERLRETHRRCPDRDGYRFASSILRVATSNNEWSDIVAICSRCAMKSKPVSAADLMSRLQSDPEWVRENTKREVRRKAAAEQRRQELRPEEMPILAELAAVGTKVDSIWDIVNAKWPYPAAIPVLAAHLQRTHHPVLRDGIARALTVPEARGEAGHIILAELQRPYVESPHAVR